MRSIVRRCSSPAALSAERAGSDACTALNITRLKSQQLLDGGMVGSAGPSSWAGTSASSIGAFPWPLRRAISSSALQGAADPVQHQDSSSASADDSSAGPMALYRQRLAAGMYRPDPRQELTASMLQELWDSLTSGRPRSRRLRSHGSGLTIVDTVQATHHPPAHPPSPPHGQPHKHAGRPSTGGGAAAKKRSGGWWAGVGSFLVGGGDAHMAVTPLHTGPHIQGLYMYGGVGCGKTMLMDLFVATATPEMQVVRTHFHDFMLSVHEQLRVYKGDKDPVLRVADSVAKRSRVLALDELFVTDVANAMILSRLFGRLWDRGCVLVSTSNRHPDGLYANGLQRPLFLPFIARLKAECVIHDMASAVDYRRLAKQTRGLYFTAPDRDEDLREEWEEFAEGAPVVPESVAVKMGRTIRVQQAAGKCALMTFHELCGQPVAAADYIALAERFHTLAVSGVPVITATTRSEGHRLVTLIDVMYEHRVRMLFSAEAPVLDLFENVVTQAQIAAQPELKASPHVVVDDVLGFAKDRTISRMTEMQSLEYLLAHAQQHEPTNVLALQEAQAASKPPAA